jgi:hypothetical protein
MNGVSRYGQPCAVNRKLRVRPTDIRAAYVTREDRRICAGT